MPSPAFVFDVQTLRARYGAFRQAFPDAAIHYALKANPAAGVIDTLAACGAGFEAASWHEIEFLLSRGVSPERIIYGTAVKPRAHIERAFASGIEHFAADASEELALLAKAAPGARVFIRVTLDDRSSVFQMNRKFGAPVKDAVRLVTLVRRYGLRPWGLSFNVGSQATRADHWAEGVMTLVPIITELLALGIHLEVINLGGGFPVRYRHQPEIPLAEIARHVAAAHARLPYPLRLVIEPGRGLVAPAVSLIAAVQSRIERPEGPWLFLDCGVYNALYEALLHQGRTAYPVSLLRPHDPQAPIASFVLAGPTGDGLDIIAREVPLPAEVAVGDRLLFENVGAYTHCMASCFNGFPIPPLRVREG